MWAVALLSFRAEFVPAIENGIAEICNECRPHADPRVKRQTIRANRSDGRPVARVGETLHLYTGLRTKKARKLGEVVCRRAVRFRISRNIGEWVMSRAPGDDTLMVGWRYEAYSLASEHRIARADGFDSRQALLAFFDRVHGLPFNGWLIQW